MGSGAGYTRSENAPPLPQLNVLLPDIQEVCDPPVGGVRLVQLKLVLKQTRVLKELKFRKSPGEGFWGVQMLKDELEVHVENVTNKPAGSVGKVQRVLGESLMDLRLRIRHSKDFMTTEIRVMGL